MLAAELPSITAGVCARAVEGRSCSVSLPSVLGAPRLHGASLPIRIGGSRGDGASRRKQIIQRWSS